MTATLEALRYPSLEALRLAHRDLLARYQVASQPASLIDEIEQFLRDAQLTGAVLEEDRPRTAGQGMLDYWAATLYRLRHEPPVAMLAPFKPSLPPAGASAICPYPGLAPFDQDSRQWFYGRQAIVADLCTRLASSRLLVVTGPSGCGKSSIVRAGLLPALESDIIPGSADWHLFPVLVPGLTPLDNLARLLFPACIDDAILADEIEAFQRDSRHLVERVRAAGSALLVVDQIDDLLPRPGKPMTDQTQAFLANLLGLTQEPDAQCRLVLVHQDSGLVRADDEIDESALVQNPSLAQLLDPEHRYDVPDLGTRELREAILQPAEQVGLRLERQEAMVADLVRALVGIPTVPPLLQFVLTQLWERREGGRISWAAYRAVLWDPERRRSNAGWALARTADELYRRLADRPAVQRALQAILLRLVEPTHGSELRLRRLRRSSLFPEGGHDQALAEGLEELIGPRLIRVSHDGAPDDPTIELVHVALARLWPELDSWLGQVRVEQALRLRLDAAVQQWREHDRGEAGLWDEVLLHDVRDLPGLEPDQLAFIAASDALIAERKREAQHREWMKLAVLMTMSCLMSALALAFAVIGFQSVKASAEARSRQHVAQSQSIAGTQPDLAVLLALEAIRAKDNPQARVSLLNAVQRNAQLISVLPTPKIVNSVAVSPDGVLLAAAYDDSVQIWDAASLTNTVTIDVDDGNESGRTVRAVVFSPDRTRVAMSLDDRSVLVRSTETGEPVGPALANHQWPIVSLAFGQQGDRISAVGLDGRVVVWSLPSGAEIANRAPNERPSLNIAVLSPDGQQIAIPTCGQQQQGRCLQPRVDVLDAITGQLLWRTDGGHMEAVTSVAFSADGQLLATGSADRSVIVWERAGEGAISQTPLIGHTHPVSSVAFNADRTLLASADCAGDAADPGGCDTGEIRIWSVGAEELQPPAISGQTGGTRSLALLPGNGRLMSARGAQALVWDPAGLRVRLRITTSPPTSLTSSDFEAAGDLASDVDANGSPGPGDGGDGTAPRSQESEPAAWAVSPDGRHLALATSDDKIVSVDLERKTRTVLVPTVRPTALDVSSSGAVASGGKDGTVEIWDPPLQTSVRLQTTGSEALAVLAFNPAGDRLASGGRDGTVAIWDVKQRQIARAPLKTHAGVVRGLEFSPDGRIMASGGADGRVLVWDVESGQQIGAQLLGHRGVVESVMFDATGEWLISMDGEIEISRKLGLTPWDRVQQRACQIAQRDLYGPELEELGIGDIWTDLGLDDIRKALGFEAIRRPTCPRPAPTESAATD